MWTITARVRRKNLDKDGAWTHILECEDQQIAHDDSGFRDRIRQSEASIAVIGRELAQERVKVHGWSLETLSKQERFSTEYGLAWVEFDDFPSRAYITVALGTKNEAAVQELLDEALRSPDLYISMTLGIGFSTVEDNPQWPEPTIRRFLQGEAAFAHGAPDFSLVSRHP